MTQRRLLANEGPQAIEVARAPDRRSDRDPALRRRPQVGDVEVGIDDLAERPWDRRRGHEQDVRRQPSAGLGLEKSALLDPEAMLLVDHGEPEVGEGDRLLEQGVGPDDDTGLAVGDRLARVAPTLGRERAREERHRHAEVAEQRIERRRVLAREQVRRREQGALAPGRRDDGEGVRRDRGLARADVALEQPEHRDRPGEVGPDRVHRRAWSAVSSTSGRARRPSASRIASLARVVLGVGRWHGDRGRAATGSAAPDHPDLEGQELVEREAPKGIVAGLERLREVRRLEGVGDRR